MSDKLWILKSKGDDSAFGGNEGYDDVQGVSYVFDSTVKNHDKIAIGDVVIISNKEYIQGFSRINQINVIENVPKKRFRCPECGTQEHYPRKKIFPRYKCRKNHVFDEPIVQDILVKQFVAIYKSKFITAPTQTPVGLLDDYYIKRNRYYSIQPAKIIFFQKRITVIAYSIVN